MKDKTTRNKKPRIIVYMEGGVIHDVWKVDGAKGTILELRDYDVEGVDPSDLKKDSQGNEYQRIIK